MADRSAIASVESSLEKGCDGGGGMYCAGGIADTGAGGGAIIFPAVAGGGRFVFAVAVCGAYVSGAPFCEGRIAGSAGCTLGVMGLYSGATGEEASWYW